MRRSCFVAAAAALSVSLLGLSGCQSVPVTGRSSVNLVSNDAVVKMSAEAFEQIKKENKISNNKAQNEMLQRVGARLADVVFWDVPVTTDWEFVVFNKPGEVNAFAMPGGKVGVFSGIFDVAKTDDELAVVLGHEIAHVAAKHVNESLSQEMMRQTGGTVIGLATGGLAGYAIYNIYQMGSGMVGLSFDRNKESEADHIGLIYMARAGYNPHAAIDLWEKMDQLESGKSVPPEWLSTHPSHENRLNQIYKWLPEAEAVYEKAKASRL